MEINSIVDFWILYIALPHFVVVERSTLLK